MPQDMSRAFLITLDRLAFMTVLVISRMIDFEPVRQDRQQNRIEIRRRRPAGAAFSHSRLPTCSSRPTL